MKDEKQQIVRTWETLKEAMTRVAGNFIAAAKEVAAALNAWRKKLDEDAKAGNPNAQYVQATLELGYWERQLAEVERLLQVTKKTVARKPLLERQKRYKELVEKWKALQTEALAKIE